MQENYLEIMVKREESKVFGCVWICLGEKLERGVRESTQKLPKIFFFFFFFVRKMRGLGVFMDLGMPFEACCTLLVCRVRLVALQGAPSQLA